MWSDKTATMDCTMKRNKSYKPKSVSVPMIVNRELEKNYETMHENAMVLAFRTGYADIQHYDYLVRLSNTMNIANSIKPSFIAKVLHGIFDALAKTALKAYQASGKFILDALDIDNMKEAVKNYDSYWKGYSTGFYNDCIAELNAFYLSLNKPCN